jgi:diguanylate cyclase (GGDEF)-like protein
VLAIDVDGLKAVNDEYGHDAGDDLLRAIAATLGGLIRPGDLLARVGGDEFALLLHGVDATEAKAVGERMQQAMYGTSVGRGAPRISVGFAVGAPGDDGPALWRRADEALYRAKRVGRDRVEGAAKGDDRGPAASSRASWGELLSRVLTQQSLWSAYQPIVRLGDRRVVGHEALARLPKGMLGDDVEELFATAKRLGRLRDLDWLGRRAALAGARGVLLDGAALFINVSSVALLDPVHDVDQMLLLCRWSGRSPEEVVLEITERETISEVGRLRGVLASYREHGFRFALDDVGEGHSTLEVLTAARPEFVKVARSLVSGAASDASLAAIRATVEFARATDAEVIAEGVETEAEAALMERLGVGCGQGWLYGRPVPAPRELRPAG